MLATKTLRRALPVAVTAALAVSAPALAAPNWAQPFTIPGSDTNIFADMVVARDGTTVALWARSQQADTSHVEVAVKPPGGIFGPRTELAKGNGISRPRLAIDGAGTVTAIWTQGDGDAPAIRASRRPAGGAFGPVQTVSDPGSTSDQVEVDGAGSTTVVTWRQQDRMRAAIATGTGGFEMQNPLSLPGQKGDYPRPTVAPDGSAVVVWRRYDANGYTLRAAARKPGQAFAPLADVLKSGTKDSVPFGFHLATTPSGRTTLVWQMSSKGASGLSRYTLQWATRGASGDFGPVGNLYGPSDDYGTDFGLAVSADDTATVAIPGPDAVRIATRPSGSNFGPIKLVGAPFTSDARVAYTASGEAIVTWLQGNATGERAMATTIGDAGPGAVRQISPAGATVKRGWDRAGLGVDDEGSAMAWWSIDPYTGSDPAHYPSWPMQVAAYDAVAPAFTRVTVPATARVGQQIALGAPARDRWTGATVTWDFGDGGTEEGENLVYAYGHAGTFTVRITATDGAGNARTITRTINVTDGGRG